MCHTPAPMPRPRASRPHTNGSVTEASARDVSPSSRSTSGRATAGPFARTSALAGEGAAAGVAVLAHALMARRTEFYRNRGREPRELPRRSGLARRRVRLPRPRRQPSGRARGRRVRLRRLRRAATSRPCASSPASRAARASRRGRRRPLARRARGLRRAGDRRDRASTLSSASARRRRSCATTSRRARGGWSSARVLASMLATARRVGRFPARALRLGSDDETLACCEDFERVARTGRWTSRDGRTDYLAALANVRVPVLQVVSDARPVRVRAGVRRALRRVLRRAARGRARHARRRRRRARRATWASSRARRVRSVWEGIEAWMRRAASEPG